MGVHTICNPAMEKKAEDYLITHEKHGDVVPSNVGMACHLGVSVDSLENWNRDETKGCFFGMLRRVQAKQQRLLLSGGLAGKMNPNIVKLMLAKHGYCEKKEIDHKSSDKSMSPVTPELQAAVESYYEKKI